MHWEANREGERKLQETHATLLLAGLIVLAIALRFWRLGEWNFQATEIFTLRDSVTPQFKNWRPLGYLLTYFLARPFLPLDEFGLRLFPAVFGVLAIPVFYFASRPLIGTRAALFGAFLLAVSPLHIMYSQLARYWSLVFLFSAVYPYALYLGIRDHNRRALALGIVTGALAVLSHPVSILLVGGPALVLLTRVRRQHLAQLWSHKTLRWTALLVVLIALVTVVRFIPMLQGWISAHDKNPGSSQFLLRAPVTPGLKQIFYLLAYVEGLTLPLVVIGVVGIYLLWHQRDRQLAIFLTSLAGFPIIFLTLVSLRTPVSTYYLLPTAAVFFVGAGVFLDHLLKVNWTLRPRWVLTAAVVVIVVAAGVPTLVSDYRDGRRWDFRGVARWLDQRLVKGDVVYSDQRGVLAHYLPNTPVHRLRDLPSLVQSMRELRESGTGEALWIVSPAPSHAFRGGANLHDLNGWMFGNCRLRNVIGVGRVDVRQNYLQIYRCSVGTPGTEVTSP